MRNSTTLAAVSIAAAASTLIPYLVWRKRATSETPLPPSPAAYPLIGNLLDMPSKEEHLGFIEIGKSLGSDVFSLNMFGTVIIVLNSAEDAISLLEKRSGIYSDRSHFPMLADPSLMDWADLVSALGYGERWRKSRRIMHQWLHKQAAEAFHPSQQRQARILLQRLLSKANHLDSSKELELEAYRAMAGTIVHSVYGLNIEDSSETFILKLKETVDNLAKAALPSNLLSLRDFLVNTFPALLQIPDWFPGADWKRTAKKWREQKNDAVDSPYNWTKSEMEKHEHNPSMVESMLGQANRLGLDANEVDGYVKQIAFILYGGGTDTTVAAILVFFVAMLLFPEVQKKAQEEIDATVGLERLPTMEDRPYLPYVGRLIQEDDIYKGYRIPKGAKIFANIWAISRNAEVYKDPEVFEPDRFLDPSVPPSPTFGFGRRLCPGIHYAGASLFIFIVSILAAFNIELARDEQGNSVVPSPEGEKTVIFHPVPFKLKLTPRSATFEQLIHAGL
ncbi:hypothetical protein FRC06_010212 [Ceratobasidium sp. 370]|nr:hypothetical protein FRC06_010212 [Ceratobasidium sp. 370]